MASCTVAGRRSNAILPAKASSALPGGSSTWVFVRRAAIEAALALTRPASGDWEKAALLLSSDEILTVAGMRVDIVQEWSVDRADAGQHPALRLTFQLAH